MRYSILVLAFFGHLLSPDPMRRPLSLLVLIAIGLASYLSLTAYLRSDALAIDPLPIPISTDARVLLVSALYPLAKSKHSSADYARWLHRFLGSIDTDVYFFTTPDLASVVRDVAAVRARSVVINTTYASPFDVPPLVGLRAAYARMHGHDRERARHSPELYAVWNAKPFFLSEGLANAGGRYRYAFWCDAGSFRSEHRYRVWPDPDRVEQLWKDMGEDRLFLPIESVPGRAHSTWKADMGPVDVDFSEGAFLNFSLRCPMSVHDGL